MAVRPVQLVPLTISTPGTAQAFAENVACTSILIQSDRLNTGSIYVGDSDVNSTNGMELTPGESIPITADMVNGNTDELFPADIFIDTDTGGNVVRAKALRRRN